jgi:hypothetical protein
MLARQTPIMAATATKTAVHVPWCEIAFKPMEMPSIPDPDTNTQSKGKSEQDIDGIISPFG